VDEPSDDARVEGRPRAHWLTAQRVLALAGTCALLGVAVAIVAMITATRGADESSAVPNEFPTATATPAPKRKPRIPKLTAAQKAERSAAVDQMAQQGFEPVTLRTYRGDRTLRVLIGRSATLGGQRAFFFAGERYVGTDTVDASERIKVVRNGERAVTLSYSLFEPGGVGSSGAAKVRFRWDGTSLAPQDALPAIVQRGPR
jgi:hypothetical protein